LQVRVLPGLFRELGAGSWELGVRSWELYPSVIAWYLGAVVSRLVVKVSRGGIRSTLLAPDSELLARHGAIV
jgi:hypothetical protein